MYRCVRPIGAALALALAGSFAVTATASAAASPSGRSDLRAVAPARAAGITQAGQAYMGWSAKAHGGPAAAGRATTGAMLTPNLTPTSGPQGIDVSAWNGEVDWASMARSGSTFAYVKATEGNYYTSSTFAQQYNGAYNAGLIRGAYHFANPSVSSGAVQADYFVSHGGGWSPDGRTLPGVLDIEYNPYGSTCYGLTTSQMSNWIASFTSRYNSLTGRDAVIYTTYDWWSQCTGNTTRFNRTNPLWVARYASTPGVLPGQWPAYTFWQHASTPIDENWFNGTTSRLKVLARGTCLLPLGAPTHLRVLHEGMTGSDVEYLQKALNELGAHLAVDHDFGPATLSAVKTFQREAHIAVDGSVGPITWSHLKAELASKACK
ncbi:GH25 family lysozyme [Leekyejoonella antrihumi]|uniref:lysozyme n=1 Tax=Leekyejoonella antrihumi TaxID=1660198 RepID=A0A563DX96_9MICO|nr:GH25 family lysozyme [Leekyejoonella antrihumi]TWP34572.1 lysozyme [Leekyejoonella antrihumi]